jgi:hypothetical protein
MTRTKSIEELCREHEWMMGSNNGVTWQAYWNGVPYQFRTMLEITDDEELLAQGRLHENAQIKRALNRLPYFKDRAAARAAIRAGTFKPSGAVLG